MKTAGWKKCAVNHTGSTTAGSYVSADLSEADADFLGVEPGECDLCGTCYRRLCCWRHPQSSEVKAQTNLDERICLDRLLYGGDCYGEFEPVQPGLR